MVLFCSAGGAAAGYHAAGFEVTGVDMAPQPHFPFRFVQADVLTLDPAFLAGFEVIHASPPCQAYSTATPTRRRPLHPDLIEPVRALLRAAVAADPGPWAYLIENVPGAPLDNPAILCGDSLRLGVRRHRLFESNLPLYGTPCWHDRTEPPVPVYGSYGQRAGRKPLDESTSRNPDVEGEASRNPLEGEASPAGYRTDHARAAMGIDWMPWPALTQAVPPAYTHWLGVQLHAHRRRRDQTPELGRDATPPAGIRHGARDGTDLGASVTETAGGLRHRVCRCGAPLTRPATGRWPRHCSPACRQAAYRARHSQHRPRPDTTERECA